MNRYSSYVYNSRKWIVLPGIKRKTIHRRHKEGIKHMDHKTPRDMGKTVTQGPRSRYRLTRNEILEATFLSRQTLPQPFKTPPARPRKQDPDRFYECRVEEIPDSE